MSMVALDMLQPGMVLAAEVRDKGGRLLLGEGVELEAKHLLIFRTWGVVEVDIVGDVEPQADILPDDISLEELERARELVRPRFIHANLEHPAMNELYQLAAIRMVTHGR